MKYVALLVALLSALVASACADGSGGGSGGLANFNKPAEYEGPGCYDHKNRIERTVRSKAECETLTWVWKP